MSLERRIDEPIGLAVDLTLRERPQLDGLGSTDQGVRKCAQPQQACGPSEEELPGPTVDINPRLYGEDQFGRALDLIDDQQSVVGDELGWVMTGGGEIVRAIESAFDGVGTVTDEVVYGLPVR